jgi:hypothetical protein
MVRILDISKLSDEIKVPKDILLNIIEEMKKEEHENVLVVNDVVVVIEEKDILMIKELLKDEKISLLDLMTKINVNSEIAKEILQWMASKNFISSERAENVIKNVTPLIEVDIDKSEVEVGDYLIAKVRIVAQDFIRPVNIDVVYSEGLLLEGMPISLEQIAPSEEGYYETLKFRVIQHGINKIEVKVKGKIRGVDFEKIISRQVTVYPRKPKLKVNVHIEKVLFGRQADLNIQVLNTGYGDAKDVTIKNPEKLKEYFDIIQDIPKGQIIPPGDERSFQVSVLPKRSGDFKIEGLFLEFKDMMDRTYLSEPINFDIHVETPQPKVVLKVSYPEQTRPSENTELIWTLHNFGAEARDARIRVQFSDGVKFIRGYMDKKWPILASNYDEHFSSIVNLERSVEKVIEKVEVSYTDVEGIQHSLILTGQEVGGDKPIKIGGRKYYGNIREFVRTVLINKPLEVTFISVKPIKEIKGRIYDLEVYSVLGKGGYGATLLAIDKYGRNVVIKMPLELCSAIEEGREKYFPTISGRVYDAFSREAEVIKRLKHPHIIRVLDVVKEQAIIILEYCANGSLRTLLDNLGRLDLKTALTVAIQIGSALEYIHTEHRIQHLDIKPSNILFTSDGILKVSDFNLARLMGTVSGESKSKIQYTPGYAAPEQMHRDLGNLGPYTDLFSLAAVLYEMLSGRTPFNVENYEKRVISEIPRYIEGIPRDLNELLIQTLSKRPEERVSSADEFIVNLAEIYVKEYGWWQSYAE